MSCLVAIKRRENICNKIEGYNYMHMQDKKCCPLVVLTSTIKEVKQYLCLQMLFLFITILSFFSTKVRSEIFFYVSNYGSFFTKVFRTVIIITIFVLSYVISSSVPVSFAYKCCSSFI